MRPSREQIYQALFDLVASDARAKANFVTISRYLKQFAEVPSVSMPALFMFQRPERRVQKGKGIDAIRTLSCHFWVYCQAGDPLSQLPATLLNTAMDILDDVITKPGTPGNAQTLGGIVEHVYITPIVDYAEALLQDTSMLVATVEILIP